MIARAALAAISICVLAGFALCRLQQAIQPFALEETILYMPRHRECCIIKASDDAKRSLSRKLPNQIQFELAITSDKGKDFGDADVWCGENNSAFFIARFSAIVRNIWAFNDSVLSVSRYRLKLAAEWLREYQISSWRLADICDLDLQNQSRFGECEAAM